MRSQIGAYQNRLEHTMWNLSQSDENLTAALSRLSDTDIAKEMIQLVKTQILQQSTMSMQANANQQAPRVLQLLA